MTKIDKVSSRKEVYECTGISGTGTNMSARSIFSERRIERHEQTREVFIRRVQEEVSSSGGLSNDSQNVSNCLESDVSIDDNDLANLSTGMKFV